MASQDSAVSPDAEWDIAKNRFPVQMYVVHHKCEFNRQALIEAHRMPSRHTCNVPQTNRRSQLCRVACQSTAGSSYSPSRRRAPTSARHQRQTLTASGCIRGVAQLPTAPAPTWLNVASTRQRRTRWLRGRATSRSACAYDAS